MSHTTNTPAVPTHAKMETFTVLVTEKQAELLEYYLTDTLPIISRTTVQWLATPGISPVAAAELTHADCDECGAQMTYNLLTQRCHNCNAK